MAKESFNTVNGRCCCNGGIDEEGVDLTPGKFQYRKR